MKKSWKRVMIAGGSCLLGASAASGQPAPGGGGNDCEAFARIHWLEQETPAQTAGALADARAHVNAECMAQVALRRLNRGDCEGGLGLAQEARRMGAGLYMARCTEGLAWVCTQMQGAQRTSNDESLAVCDAETPRRMADLVVSCSLDTNLSFTRTAALEATRDLARVCQDPGGVILAAVSTLARNEANNRPLQAPRPDAAARRALLDQLAPELVWIRQGFVPPSIEAAQTVDWAAHWIRYRDPSDPMVHPMRRRMRRVLMGAWGASGALPDNSAVTTLTHGLLEADALEIDPSGGSFGEILDDVERLFERRVFDQPRAALALMPVPFGAFTNAAMEPGLRARLERLRTRLCGLGTADGALFCFRLGAALIPPGEASCDRAQTFVRAMEEFRSTGAARSLRPDLVDPTWAEVSAAAAGAASRCESGGETLLTQVHVLRDGLRNGIVTGAP